MVGSWREEGRHSYLEDGRDLIIKGGWMRVSDNQKGHIDSI